MWPWVTVLQSQLLSVLLKHREKIIRSRCFLSDWVSAAEALRSLQCPACKSGKQLWTNELSDCSTGQFEADPVALCGIIVTALAGVLMQVTQ